MYIDGFLLPVPKQKVAEYRRIARRAGRIWMEYGALEYRECVADDMHSSFGVSFTRTIEVKRGETVIFSWIGFRSRAHRDRVNRKVLADPRVERMMDPKKPTFDYMRMAYGGFRVVVNLTR